MARIRSEAATNAFGTRGIGTNVPSDRSVGTAAYRYCHSFFIGLHEAGVHHVVVCPGSRSTPLALVAASYANIRMWNLVDERSAAYFGLGLAKGGRRPVALICTSGTAAANFLPAVVEAKYGRSPLVVLTADRPPELRESGALQTIDQRNLYGVHVKGFVEAALPADDEASLQYARHLAAQVVEATVGETAGPFHVNFPFREPLLPDMFELGEVGTDKVSPPLKASTSKRLTAEATRRAARMIRDHDSGLIICGPIDNPEFAGAITRLARIAGYPILADPLSQLRAGSHDQSLIIDSYDGFLRVPAIADTLRPQLIFRCGMTPISKALTTFLSTGDILQVTIDLGSHRVYSQSSDFPRHHFDIDPTNFAIDVAECLGDFQS